MGDKLRGGERAIDKESLPPLGSVYVRQHCVPKASAPMARELLTLAAVCDCLPQARPAEATDTAIQRVKALELMMSGQSWMTSQKLEIIPGPEPGVATRAELQGKKEKGSTREKMETKAKAREKTRQRKVAKK